MKIKKNPPLYVLTKAILRPFINLIFNFKKVDNYKIKKGEHVIILSNHVTDFDPIILHVAFNRFLYILSTDNIFADKFAAKMLTTLGAIPKRKGTSDFDSIKKLMGISREGGSILIFPEGNRSYVEEQFFISEKIGKFTKAFNATLILYNIEGGFARYPRFGHKKRKAKMYGKIKEVIPYEKLKEMDNDELTAKIISALKVDDSEKYHVKGNARAEYLERLFFLCPKCFETSSLRSEGNIIKCEKCGYEAEYSEDLHLISHDSSVSYTRLREWYHSQKEYVKNHEFKGEIFKDDNVELYLANPYHNKDLLSKGEMILTNKELIFKDQKFDIKDIAIASPVSGKKLCFTIGENNYQVNGHPRFNALKYVMLFNKLETKMKINKTDVYYNLD